MAQFRARHPGVAIELHEHGSRALQRQVLAGELDMAVSLLPIPPDLDWFEVRDDPLVALLPAGHPLSGRERLRLAELADTPFILFDAGFALNEILQAACLARGLTLQEAARSGQPDFIVALVAAGLGVALLPRLVADQHAPSSMSASLLEDEDVRWTAGLVWRAGGDLSPAARAWLALVREEIAGPAGAYVRDEPA
jgi:DNA-binding transcriptional LysR family regulator